MVKVLKGVINVSGFGVTKNIERFIFLWQEGLFTEV
jgi:hypothetical protein